MTDRGDRSYGVGLTTSAWEKRKKQLANWEASETNREPSYLRTTTRVKFSKDVMFLAAVGSGDEEEVDRLLKDEKVDINCRNNDGMTAVHQCCIDDDLAMLKVVIKQGGDINGLDNEGWTPLHAAASCGYSHIVNYLLECGSFPAPLNNDGQTPSDLAEDYDEVVQLLQAEINRLGIDIDDIKCEEERQMLEDAKKLRNNPDLEPIISPGGATPLHVAASKNYTTVLNVLLSIKGLDINIKDDDGWTPLHAAVHWESMEAAELLIFNGANVFAKTDAGEDLDDLIDPDLEEELKELKKLNSYINPEQEHIRKRRPQVARRTSSSLTHSNSFDNKHGIITRRLSKEKLTMIDMKKEKEDLMHSYEKFDEEETVPLSNATLSNSSHNDTNINNKVGVSTDIGQTPPPLIHSNSSGSLTGSNSPKNNRRKGELSKNILDRMNVFQIGGPSPSGTSSPRTSTPVCSPPVNANGGGSSTERKKVDSSDMPPSSRGRVNSLGQTTVTTPTTNNTITSTAKNRFSFQPKSVSGMAASSTSKTMSLDRGSEHLFHEAVSTYNNTPSRSTSSSSSSSSSSSLRTIVESKGSKKTDTPATPTSDTPTFATPTSNTSVVAMPTQATPTEATPRSTSTPIQTTVGADTSSMSSIDSSKDRTGSFAVSQPETKRKSVARNKRESRRATQPLPADLLERISKHDQMEEQQNTEQATPTSATPTKVTSSNSMDISVTMPSPPPMATPTPPLTTPTTTQPTTPTPPLNTHTTTQAAMPTVSQMTTPTGENEGTPNLSPQQIPRSKSSNRRKPKEKRRSTGIATEVDSDCEIPDNLKGIVSHSRSGSGDSSDGGLTNTCNITDIQGTDESSISASAIEYYQQEIATLKQLLQEEKKKNETIVCTYQQTCAKLETKETELSNLQKKQDETVLVLEKERAEKENKDKRIMQLEKSQKGIQELKAEIQRLKDENGALIRVVGKLSRAPITT